MDKLDVIVHELCHFFFENATESKFASMQREFESFGKIEARAAYNLLDEGLASTLGNGLINKLIMDKKEWEIYYAKPQSFYNSYHIDKTAKSIFPWMEGWIKNNRTLFDAEFVKRYIFSMEQALGGELGAPKLLLNELVFVADAKFGSSFRDLVRKAIGPSSMYTSEGEFESESTFKAFRENASLSTLFIFHASNIDKLREKNILSETDFEAVKNALKENRMVTYSFKRSASAPGYIIVASSFEDALNLVNKLATTKVGFTGVSP